VQVHGWVTKSGSRAGFAEADVRDAEGRVLATASSTCAIFATC
jgi:acyl-coenzyme A thioesterase PaaI-like protein